MNVSIVRDIGRAPIRGAIVGIANGGWPAGGGHVTRRTSVFASTRGVILAVSA